jgi:hypothetical protein
MTAATVTKSGQHLIEKLVREVGVSDFTVVSGQAVTVPSIADADTGNVIVTETTAFGGVEVGDIVWAWPEEALPTDCQFTGAYVVDSDDIKFTFTAEDGAVTGAAKDFTVIIVHRQQ